MTASRMKALQLGLAALALCLSVGSLLLRSPSHPGPEASGGKGEETPAASATAASDPVVLADAARDACAGKSHPQKLPCYESFLLPLASGAGVEVAMETLRRIGALDRDIEREGHVFAHGIGIEAYQAQRDVHRTFASCSEIYQSGCYHGVIQAYFEDLQGPGASEVNDLCRPYSGTDPNKWLLFQCVHGLGHGLTMFYDHDLLQALRGCDLLVYEWDRQSCYGGAFMENIVNATMPHHPAGALGPERGTGTPAGHAHGAGPAPERGVRTASRFKALDPDDLHYPCSAVDERYWVACYMMQTSAILHFNGGDIAAAARTCDNAPPSMRTVCYQSLGRDISSYTLQDHAESIRLCSLGDPRYQPWCYVGLAKNFVDLTARTEGGFSFCRSVPGRPNKMKCYEALGEQIAVLENGLEQRAALCEQSEPEYREACRYGARLISEAPTGLPTGA